MGSKALKLLPLPSLHLALWEFPYQHGEGRALQAGGLVSSQPPLDFVPFPLR